MNTCYLVTNSNYLADVYMKTELLIVLGAPNFPEGLLSAVALSRLDACCALFHPQQHTILLTGGYGPHFNNSNKPHAWYGQQYLIGKGVPASQILSGVNSRNTVEDALLSKPVVSALQPARVTVITSEYHLQRAGIIFTEVYNNLAPLHFIAAPSYDLSLQELQVLLQHEEEALAVIYKTGQCIATFS